MIIWLPSEDGAREGRAFQRRPHSKGHGNILSLLLAIDRKGVVASKIVKGGVTGDKVAKFFEKLPINRPVILDNYRIHGTGAVKSVCAARNLELRFTTPYSPWYNPVERAFAQAKRACEWSRLISNNFRRDIRTSLTKIKNFDGLFEASKREWLEDSNQAKRMRSIKGAAAQSS